MLFLSKKWIENLSVSKKLRTFAALLKKKFGI